jgi:hypothetical protein
MKHYPDKIKELCHEMSRCLRTQISRNYCLLCLPLGVALDHFLRDPWRHNVQLKIKARLCMESAANSKAQFNHMTFSQSLVVTKNAISSRTRRSLFLLCFGLWRKKVCLVVSKRKSERRWLS